MAINAPRTIIEQTITDEVEAGQPEPLYAFVLGPDYAVRRYEDNKAAVMLGAYANADAAFGWPGRNAGEEVDFDFTEVTFEAARLQYFEDAIGSGGVIAPVAGKTNQISSATLIWATGNGFTRSASVPTDVKAGDQIELEEAGGEILSTYVKAILPEVVADVIDAPVASGDNAADQVAAESITPDGGNTGDVPATETADGSAYDGLASGDISETYTVTCIQASTGGDATTAVLSVVSASGNDDDAALIPAAFDSDTAVGSRGLTVNFPTGGDFAVGDIWVVTVDQLYTAAAAASAGDYVGTQDTTYRVRVIRGGALDGDSLTGAAIEITTLNGIDASGPHYPVVDVPLAIGTNGVTVTFDSSGTSDLVNGDSWTIEVTAESDGQLNVIELTNDLPADLLAAGDLKTTISIEKDIEVDENRLGYAPLKNFEQSATEITLKAGILSTDSRVVDTQGDLVDLVVTQGTAYATYRALRTDNANVLQTIEGGSDPAAAVQEYFGSTDADGVLNFGVLCALEGALGTAVRFIALESDDLEGYTAAVGAVREVDAGWGFVPMTNDQDVRLMIKSSVLSRSSSEQAKWSAAWFGQDMVTVNAVQTADEDGFELQATITDDPNTSGTQYTLVNDADGTFITGGVQSGDTLRTQFTTDGFGNDVYSEYTVDEVLTNESLRLLSGPDSEISLASKYEIHRPLGVQEQADDYGSRASVLTDRRVRVCFPSAPKRAGIAYPNYFMAATLAGQRSNAYPHQPLSNNEVNGWDDMSQAAIEFSGQLNDLLNYGVWIVTQDVGTAGVAGAPYTFRQVTTDLSDLRNLEDSIVANGDAIARHIRMRFAGTTGKQNIFPGQIDKINAQLVSVLEELGQVENEDYGPQVITYDVIQVRQHAVYRDRIFAQVQVTVPTPLNDLEIQLDLVI